MQPSLQQLWPVNLELQWKARLCEKYTYVSRLQTPSKVFDNVCSAPRQRTQTGRKRPTGRQPGGLFKQRRSQSSPCDPQAVLLHPLHAFLWPLPPLLRQSLRHFVTGSVPGTHDPVPGPESRGGRPEETYLDIYRRVCTHVVKFSDQPQRNYEPERLINDSAWKIQWLPCWALPK